MSLAKATVWILLRRHDTDSGLGTGESSVQPHRQRKTDMAKDPICGMTVEEATALRAESDGETFYFCSEHCRERFLSKSAPAKPDGVRDGGSVPHVAPTHHSHDSQHSHHDHEDAAVTPSTLNSQPSTAANYFCPMCPGVESEKPGDCPKCGMALERNPTTINSQPSTTLYTCPMHPEVQQDHPGNCPKCGMALEPMTVSAVEEQNPELADTSRRFWIGGALALPVFLLAMVHLVPSLRHESWVMGDTSRWIQFVLSTPVVV